MAISTTIANGCSEEKPEADSLCLDPQLRKLWMTAGGLSMVGQVQFDRGKTQKQREVFPRTPG
ncbi:MAG: hypothetical protein B5M55_00845 [Desulfococcus sp. 4484_242]|nr:MAG: hypothetical protein B5M55_00845 [Desulfococcus sp. 4484_242]